MKQHRQELLTNITYEALARMVASLGINIAAHSRSTSPCVYRAAENIGMWIRVGSLAAPTRRDRQQVIKTQQGRLVMARVAPRIYTHQVDLVRLESVVQQLRQDQRVQVTLLDGGQQTGIVSAVPVMQVFFDPQGREGMNAMVKLDHRAGDQDCTLWLDEIASITRLPNPSPPQPSNAWPPDPNAPVIE